MKEEGTSGQVEKEETVDCPADAPGRLIRYFRERCDRAE